MQDTHKRILSPPLPPFLNRPYLPSPSPPILPFWDNMRCIDENVILFLGYEKYHRERVRESEKERERERERERKSERETAETTRWNFFNRTDGRRCINCCVTSFLDLKMVLKREKMVLKDLKKEEDGLAEGRKLFWRRLKIRVSTATIISKVSKN